MRHLRIWGPLLLLLWLFGFLMVGGRSLSLTSDEPAHIAAGYAILARGLNAFWVLPQHGHPPLLNVLEALGIYLEKRIPLEQLDGWPLWLTNYVRAFTPYLMPMERTEVLARIPVMGLTVLLGALIFRWGKDLWGYRAGILALGFLCLDSLLLAHGRLATTDAGTVALGTASLYAIWKWSNYPSWTRSLGLGVLVGLTMLAKSNGILWVVTGGFLIFWKTVRDREGRIFRLAQGILAGLVGFLILWGGHAFTWGPVRDLPGTYPAPDYWNGLISQALSAEKRWVFALGMRMHGHWWWYFPLAFLIKNPIPLLLAFFVGGFRLLRRPSLDCLMILGFFPLLYAITSVTSGMNIGYRHLLPVHPMIYLVIGGGISQWLSSPRPVWKVAIGAVLGLWYTWGTVRMFPYEIAYFNEFIGGPSYGHYYLIDSNIDWGQGYKALRRYLTEHPGPVPKIAYHFTNVLPQYYGISAEALPPEELASPLVAPFHPLPGRYVISITTLQRGWPEDPDLYAWFREVRPTAEIGYSFFLYDVQTAPLQWIAQCSVPAAPLSEGVIERGFGQESLRRVEFDCTSGWIYPSGGSRPGVYSFRYDLLKERRRTFPSLLLSPPEPRDPFIVRRLGQARLSVDMNRYTLDHPAFVLYEQENAPDVPTLRTAAVLPVNQVPGSEVRFISAPIALNGPLTFRGVNAIREGSEMDVETWWQVTEGPITRPLSIMGHLLNGAGELIGQDDGLGVSPVLWQPGDIIVQRHRFPLPPAGEELWLRTGAYWLDTMERWATMNTLEEGVLWVSLKVKRAH